MMIMQKKDAKHVFYLRKDTLCYTVNFIYWYSTSEEGSILSLVAQEVACESLA